MRCTHRDADNVRCVKAEGHVSPHRCVSYLDSQPARIKCTKCGLFFGAKTTHKCKGVQDANDMRCTASTAEWRLKAAIELLGSAVVDVESIHTVIPTATFDHIANAKTAALVALSQLQTIIKRMPK